MGDAPTGLDISEVTVWNGPVHLTTRIRSADSVKSRLGGIYIIIDTGKRQEEPYAFGVRWNESRGVLVLEAPPHPVRAVADGPTEPGE